MSLTAQVAYNSQLMVTQLHGRGHKMVSPLLCASASGSDHFLRSCAHWMYSCTKYDGFHRKESDGETPHMNDPLFSCPLKTMPKCILMLLIG